MSVLSVYRLFRNRTTDVAMLVLCLIFLAYQVGASEQGCVDASSNDPSVAELGRDSSGCQ